MLHATIGGIQLLPSAITVCGYQSYHRAVCVIRNLYTTAAALHREHFREYTVYKILLLFSFGNI